MVLVNVHAIWVLFFNLFICYAFTQQLNTDKLVRFTPSKSTPEISYLYKTKDASYII